MGHKRKKFSERVAERSNKGYQSILVSFCSYDDCIAPCPKTDFSFLSPQTRWNSFDESPFKNATSDTPKGFSRIMFKKESMQQRINEKRQGGSSEDLGKSAKGKNSKDINSKDKKPSDELRIKPGERMGDFSRRVDDHMRDKLMKASKDNTAGGSKKKK